MTKKIINNLIAGGVFLGTGGGGDPKAAKKIFTKIKKLPKIKKLSYFKKDDLLITGFGVGSAGKSSDIRIPTKTAAKLLSKYLNNQQIKGVIPVEIGALSLANAFYLASLLNVPIVDADIVGGRSTPEVFLETLSLFGVPRTPAAVVNQKGDAALLIKSTDCYSEEKFFRNFAAMSDGEAIVVGYPISAQKAFMALEKNTIGQAIEIGGLLQQKKLKEINKKFGSKIIFQGTISLIKKTDSDGFLTMEVFIKNRKTEAKVFIKNECLLCWINGKTTLTCPDLISFLDSNQQPLTNNDLRLKQRVQIIGFPARPLWHSSAGKKLFNPKTFDFKKTKTVLL